MRIIGFFTSLLLGLLVVYVASNVYAGLMPHIEDIGTTPEVAMWKLMPLALLVVVFIASVVVLIRPQHRDKGEL